MTRLRSPHTVNVYGAMTRRSDRLVLVMELLPGGDLRSLLKRHEEPLLEERARQIVADVCAGMAFLHSMSTFHGDLKSANVLFDGAGRAKVRRYHNSLCKGVMGCWHQANEFLHRFDYRPASFAYQWIPSGYVPSKDSIHHVRNRLMALDAPIPNSEEDRPDRQEG